MSESTFFVSEAALRNLKRNAQHRVGGVSSSHLSEAVAASMGFRTHAALRAALAGKTTVEVPKPSNALLVERLRQLGYPRAPDGLRAVPEFEHSYTPFRNMPLRKRRGVRWHAWRNLMVTAINAGLEQRLFGLSPDQNWWPGGAPDSHECAASNYHFKVDGELDAVARVDAISGDELSIYVVVSPRDPEVKPDFWGGLADGDAFAHAWLERRLGAWIQDGGTTLSCRRVLQGRLASMPVTPKGYSDMGSFFL